MDIVLGATGHVGSKVAEHLLKRGEDVAVVTRSKDHASSFQKNGAEVRVADVCDVPELCKIFSDAENVFLLNPPGDITKDSEAEEKKSLYSIIEAIKSSSVKRVVAESTYGAQRGFGIGDLGVLYEMEEALSALPIELNVIRAAYYMSNWEASLQSARDEGVVYSMFPENFLLPMVAPEDLGLIAAELLHSENYGELRYVEGPKRYSPRDVADAFSKALNKEVRVEFISPDRWISMMRTMGFSEESAASYANMTKIALQQDYDLPRDPVRGNVTLESYIKNLCSRSLQ
jgi:uncharacterized protein YbjT (DUF2867 family)